MKTCGKKTEQNFVDLSEVSKASGNSPFSAGRVSDLVFGAAALHTQTEVGPFSIGRKCRRFIVEVI